MAHSVDSNTRGLGSPVSIPSLSIILFNSTQTITEIGSQEAATNTLRQLFFQSCERKKTKSEYVPFQLDLTIRSVLNESLVRSLFPLEKTPGLISLLAGKPNPSTFPFNSITFTAKSPSNPQEEVKLTLDGDDLAQSLQYGDTAGLKPLLDWIGGLQEVNHGRKKNEGWRISIGSGSQDLIYKVSRPTDRIVDDWRPLSFPRQWV